MSDINAFFEQEPLGPAAARVADQGDWPVHCATDMEIVVPAVGGTGVEYTFGPEEGPVRLPPVWRCRCGFQLDAWVTGWPEQAEETLTPGQRVPALAVGA